MGDHKLTRQGVRDLDSLGPKPKEKMALPCEHRRMTECHPPAAPLFKGCGHFFCPDCGLSWDDEFEGRRSEFH